jgi:hypothetical protein
VTGCQFPLVLKATGTGDPVARARRSDEVMRWMEKEHGGCNNSEI